ncbi:thioredoxin domain-containing protein [Pseudonocardia benzenivorans]|nr:thioredoxin [Pseudonocardia sp. D17]
MRRWSGPAGPAVDPGNRCHAAVSDSRPELPGVHMNRLAGATSPYLRQHADNPVDWWEWCDEAFEEARRRDVPVLLSIGYGACHWCHVMAHESFSDPATAAQINERFVAVKVDREERPDVDAIYMSATQSMTGRGGWPMTCFLTPEREPFHCGTYYPPTARPGLPGFRQVLDAVTRSWVQDPHRVREAAREIATRLEEAALADRVDTVVGPAVLDAAAETLYRDHDTVDGGFGGAPKFPPALCLEFLLHHHERTGSARSLQIVGTTCERMARGGLYDQLGGGFARYSVDRAWVVPHFEKMLYDNALLLRVFARLARVTGSPLATRVTVETGEFLLREMRTANGGFAAALDADADGIEGLTYVWSPGELMAALGLRDGVWAANLLSVTSAGTVGRGRSTLQLPADPDDADRWRRVRATLHDVRRTRPQPARDDTVVTAWNGMTAQALAEAGAWLGRADWIAAATAATELLLDEHMVRGRLRRSSGSGGVGRAAAVLEDHAWLAEALLTLHQVTGDPARLDAAARVLDLALTHFTAPGRIGVYFDTPDDGEPLLHRPRDVVDNATPSGSSALAGALVTASALSSVDRAARYRAAAEAAVEAVGEVVAAHPRFAGHWLGTAERLLAGPVQVAVVGSEDDPQRDKLLACARSLAPTGSVVVAGGPHESGVPLLADKGTPTGRATAYVCRGAVCHPPVSTVDHLERQLADGTR